MEAPGVLPRWSQVAAVIGPIVFVAVFLLFGFLTPGYSAVSDVISNLEIVPDGWIQQLNFLQCGTLIIVFAIGFRQGMRGVIHERLDFSTTLLILSGSGMVGASYFTPATPIEHVLLGFLLFMIPLLISFFVIGRQLLRTRAMRSLGYYSLATGLSTLVLLVYFFLMGASAAPGVVPTGLTGIVNRLFIIVSLAWFVVMGARLRGSRSIPQRQ